MMTTYLLSIVSLVGAYAIYLQVANLGLKSRLVQLISVSPAVACVGLAASFLGRFLSINMAVFGLLASFIVTASAQLWYSYRQTKTEEEALKLFLLNFRHWKWAAAILFVLFGVSMAYVQKQRPVIRSAPTVTTSATKHHESNIDSLNQLHR